MKKLIILGVVLAVLGTGAFALTLLKPKPPAVEAPVTKPKPAPIATAYFVCDAGKTISASFYDQKNLKIIAPGARPEPTGWVELMFGDQSTTSLTQTISADGGRYANADETFVFWNKGRGALVLENSSEKNYTHCIEVAKDAGGVAATYHSSTLG